MRVYATKNNGRKISKEIIDAANGVGAAVKKREDTPDG